MKRLLNLEYAGVHGFYWMIYGVVCSFASVFLLSRGYDNSQIGLILAAGNVAAVFLQPLLADLADRSKKISLIGLTELAAVVMAVLMALLFVMNRATLALAAVFLLLLAWVTALQPLFNSLAFKLEESGHKINFGVARSMGSLAYSIMCAFLGTLAEKHGVSILPLTGELLLALLFITLLLLARHFRQAVENRRSAAANADTAGLYGMSRDAGDADEERNRSREEPDIDLRQFIRRNKLFMLISLGVGGIFFSNAVFNNFMLQIVEGVGGNSEDMGRVLSLMAFLEIPPMFFFSRVHMRFSCQTLLKLAALCFTIKVVWTLLAQSVLMVFAAQFFQLLSFGLFLPAMVVFIDELMERGEAVKGQALYTIVITVSTVFASLTGGFLLDLGGSKALLLAASLVTAAGTLLFILVIGRLKPHK